jgi:hypothetical protein
MCSGIDKGTVRKPRLAAPIPQGIEVRDSRPVDHDFPCTENYYNCSNICPNNLLQECEQRATEDYA